ncbi:hypothetical protein MJO28_007487 [Puccinia striiformis f. sp. tritici]|uniref:Uncharacterized protein n=1 Tax=Puccinia striiformis f. sp. tritici TaxID=168172 RepID=A0ACC0EG82_9BASI|nr:hypothetical protein MJO28_007487 [Puccinia striiformis f. sp. tritici]
MVYRAYPPAIKAVAVRRALEGESKSEVCRSLGYLISRQSFSRWIELLNVLFAIPTLTSVVDDPLCSRPTIANLWFNWSAQKLACFWRRSESGCTTQLVLGSVTRPFMKTWSTDCRSP